MGGLSEDSYKEVAKLTYDGMLEMRRLSYSTQADYGKWLISSIFLMHGSAIAGLAFRASATGMPPYLSAVLWFVFGMILALGAGFSAWWNFSAAADQYNTWAKPAMLFDQSSWPTEAAKAREIEATKWLSIGCGVLSVVALLGGAVHVLWTWK